MHYYEGSKGFPLEDVDELSILNKILSLGPITSVRYIVKYLANVDSLRLEVEDRIVY